VAENKSRVMARGSRTVLLLLLLLFVLSILLLVKEDDVVAEDDDDDDDDGGFNESCGVAVVEVEWEVEGFIVGVVVMHS
jgi:hypothetical protein